MADKPTPKICAECNVLPTEHICDIYFVNYICDICSQQRGVPEGIIRCNKCALNPSNLPSKDADANNVATSWSLISVQHCTMEKIIAQIDNNVPKKTSIYFLRQET